MGSHILRFGDKQFEVRIKRLANGEPDVAAYEVVPGEPGQALPELPDEQKWLQAIRIALEKELGPPVR